MQSNEEIVTMDYVWQGDRQGPGTDASQLSLSHKIVESALAYKGKLKYIGTRTSYVRFSPVEGSVANDFMLLFCYDLGNVPEVIKKEVNNRYLQAKNPEDNSGANKNQLRMCCWDFCFLTLFDAGVVKKEELNAICCIVNARKQDNLTIAHALYNKALDSYPKVSRDKMPSPGNSNDPHFF